MKSSESDPQAIEVSPELKSELNARLADFERNPEAGYSWHQVKAQLKNGVWGFLYACRKAARHKIGTRISLAFVYQFMELVEC